MSALLEVVREGCGLTGRQVADVVVHLSDECGGAGWAELRQLMPVVAHAAGEPWRQPACQNLEKGGLAAGGGPEEQREAPLRACAPDQACVLAWDELSAVAEERALMRPAQL